MMLPLSPMEILTLIKGLITILEETAQAPREFIQLQRTLGYVSDLLSGIIDQGLTDDEETKLGNWWRDCQECLTKTTNYLKTYVKVQSGGIIGFYARLRWTFTDPKKISSDLERLMTVFIAYTQLLQTERWRVDNLASALEQSLKGNVRV
ncbi:MAG: hypothetical protein M1830_001013 [Pleopsidium flavum]|nr:MAG: hypothetical protein M1830_001013 [Pleopsidium flavum]